MQTSNVSFKPGRYAAIDIGTVTCRLLVADVDEQGRLSEVHRDRAITNLGIGVDESGRLAADAIERVGATIDRFAAALDDLRRDGGVSIAVRAVATSAARDASNSDELIARLAQAGINLDIIPGTEEAGLSFSGATSAFGGQRAVVLDVGGGSSEVIAGEAGGAPALAHSFQIGCRRVTERFLASDPPAREELDAAGAWIADEIAAYFGQLAQEGYLDGRVIAVAGTATSVVSMREQMEVYDSSRVHGAVVTRADMDALLARLSALTLEQRRKVVGLDPDRAPVIVAGLLILQQIMEVGGIGQFTVSESDILHGIVRAAAR